MSGVRKAGFLCASIGVAGGAAYLLWKYAAASSSTLSPAKEKSGTGTNPDPKRAREDEGVEEEEETPVAPTSPSAQPAGTQVLVLGLDGAGKTSLLNCWATGTPPADVQPTQGFNAISINKTSLRVEFLEVGGREELRPFWQRYMSRALMLVFVVDSSNPQLFPLAKRHLHELLDSHPCLPLMVLANKQDLPEASSIHDLYDALALTQAKARQLYVFRTYVERGAAQLGQGVEDAWKMIVEVVVESRLTR